MIRVLPVIILLLTLAIACAGDDDNDNGPTATPAAETLAPDATPTPDTAPPAAPADPTETPEPTIPGVQVERVFGDLTFQGLTGMYQMPDGRWLVTEQGGRVMQFDPDEPGSAAVFLDVRDRVNSGGMEEGLLGLALAPDFDDSGELYLHYSASNPRRNVLSRFQATSDAADPNSETIVLEVQQPFGNHNGGQIKFGPDGYLYVALGDGGGAYDPQSRAQDRDTRLGSILRIDVSGGGEGYTIPDDNPFVGQAGRDEIWAYGLRNPWRFSFDMETGDLWAADVGQSSWEEVNLVTAGGNYGWDIMEGSHCVQAGCDQTGLELPVFEYETGANCSITGGFVYHGNAIPDLRGAYVYGDYCSGRIWALRWNGNEVTQQDEIADAGIMISSFAQDAEGEIYALDHRNGGIYRLAP